MKIMCIKPIHRKSRSTGMDPVACRYPYLQRGVTIERVNQVWQIDISYIPMVKEYTNFYNNRRGHYSIGEVPPRSVTGKLHEKTNEQNLKAVLTNLTTTVRLDN